MEKEKGVIHKSGSKWCEENIALFNTKFIKWKDSNAL